MKTAEEKALMLIDCFEGCTEQGALELISKALEKQERDTLSLVAKWLAATSPAVHELFLKEFKVA